MKKGRHGKFKALLERVKGAKRSKTSHRKAKGRHGRKRKSAI